MPGLLDEVELLRTDASGTMETDVRGDLGQFLTPKNVASLMAQLIGQRQGGHIRLLEPGAGAGSLIAAAVEEMLRWTEPPARISIDAYEIDSSLLAPLQRALDLCATYCRDRGTEFDARILHADFIAHSTQFFRPDFFGSLDQPRYDLVIANPPYRKINTDSEHRRRLRLAGIETSNLYSAFMGIAVQLLEPGGEVVAITSRSFCNGPYFRPFRNLLLRSVAIQHIHLFDSRKEAFGRDNVLQENIIWHGTRAADPDKVTVAVSAGPDSPAAARTIDYDQMVWPGDSDQFIHIVPDASSQRTTDYIRNLPCALHELGLDVSTGRVVDFRARRHLRMEPEAGAAPLIYPSHLVNGSVQWPINGRKPNALTIGSETRDLLVPNEPFVLLKRFTSKEEKRRIVAAVYDPALLPESFDDVGFENHLNYIHRSGRGLPLMIARGLTLFLNSSPVDAFFRQYSGHTQVNVADLRLFRFPSPGDLQQLGECVGDALPVQSEIDEIVDRVVGHRGAAA